MAAVAGSETAHSMMARGDRFSTRSILSESEAADLLARHVRLVFFVLVADEFENVSALLQVHLLNLAGPRLGVSLRIVNRRLDFERSKILAVKALGDVERLGSRVTLVRVEPGLIVESGRLNDQRVAIPAARRIA